MNTQPIESGFTQMGARVKVREIPSRWTQGDRSWISPQDYSLDIHRDGKGEFFELRVPTHLSNALDVTVMQSEPKQRHLLLFVRKPGDKPRLDRFLCGHDEREWFVAAVPGGASSVRQAMDALQPAPVRQALASHKVSTNKRYSRKNRAFRRQGEWFFVPEPTLAVDPKLIKLGSLLYVPLLEGRLMPGRAPAGGYVHDGCVVADDVGGGIKGNQLDLFVGRRGWFLGMSGSEGSHAWARSVPVYDGTKICERRGRVVAKKTGAI